MDISRIFNDKNVDLLVQSKASKQASMDKKLLYFIIFNKLYEIINL